jgi:hypothetical protein
MVFKKLDNNNNFFKNFSFESSQYKKKKKLFRFFGYFGFIFWLDKPAYHTNLEINKKIAQK